MFLVKPALSAAAMSCLPSHHHHAVVSRANDALNHRCQFLVSRCHFVVILVFIVDALDTANGVTKTSLGSVAINASAGQPRSHRPSEIVQPDSLNAGLLHQPYKRPDQRNRAMTIIAKYKLAAVDHRYGFKHSHCRPA